MRNRLSTVPSSAEVRSDVAHSNDSADRFRHRLAASPTSRGASRTADSHADNVDRQGSVCGGVRVSRATQDDGRGPPV